MEINKSQICDQEFVQTSLKFHSIAKFNQKIATKQNKCEICGKSFSRTEHLKKHIHAVHEGHKDYKCESCGKSFSDAQYLKKHMHTIHEGHKNYKCESCGKSFSEEGTLKRHIRTIHEGHRLQM